MGQKTNPIGLRLGINKPWSSVWFDEENYAERLHEDAILRKYLFNQITLGTGLSNENISEKTCNIT